MPMQSQHFSFSQNRSGSHFRTVPMHLQAVYTDILSLLHRRWFQVYILQVNGSVHAKFGSRWSRSAGSRSPQKLLYKIIHAWNFCHKDQVVFDHSDCK